MKLKSRPTQKSIELRVLPELLSRVEACGGVVAAQMCWDPCGRVRVDLAVSGTADAQGPYQDDSA